MLSPVSEGPRASVPEVLVLSSSPRGPFPSAVPTLFQTGVLPLLSPDILQSLVPSLAQWGGTTSSVPWWGPRSVPHLLGCRMTGTSGPTVPSEKCGLSGHSRGDKVCMCLSDSFCCLLAQKAWLSWVRAHLRPHFPIEESLLRPPEGVPSGTGASLEQDVMPVAGDFLLCGCLSAWCSGCWPDGALPGPDVLPCTPLCTGSSGEELQPFPVPTALPALGSFMVGHLPPPLKVTFATTGVWSGLITAGSGASRPLSDTQ